MAETNITTNNVSDDTLKTLDYDGAAPKTRVGSGDQAYQIWTSLALADDVRSKRRTLVKGLVDGNPPYNPADLASAGQSYRCNVNWGSGKAYLDNASGAFYDLFKEAPTYAQIRINKGNPDEQERYSRSVTTHFDWLVRGEKTFNYNMQVSQGEMTLYAVGPLVFNDEIYWCPRAILAESLKVPNGTKSDTSYWEYCTVEVDYKADELWRKIVDEKVATKAGWNVSAVKQAIMNASPYYNQGQLYQQWEWHQQQLKNGALGYSDNSKSICVVHLFFQEFSESGNKPGKISQVTVNRDQAAQKGGSVFLYQKIGRFDSWGQCVHPMYYDRGVGGQHHAVTGLGTKMYPALTFINRLRCANADKAFAPKLMFKPSTATNADEFSLEVHGDYMVLNEGFEPVQIPNMSYLEDGMIFDRFIGNELNANLSQYRKSNEDEPKSHVTATKTKYDAANEARLAKTQNDRYYDQLDGLYDEMYFRAIYQGKNNVGYGSDRCKEFVKRCEDDGVPREYLDRKCTEYVRATRVFGQGSEFMRQQSLEFLLQTVFPMLAEGGRFKMIQDVIASRAGQHAVDRYAPEQENPLPDNQVAWAVSQTADMKIGVGAVITEDQNPAVFATVFIDAAMQSIQSLEQGGNPAEVVGFLQLCGQAAGAQINRMAQDPTRKQLVKELTAKLNEIGAITDKITEQLQQQQQMEQEQAQALAEQQQAQMSDQALKYQAMIGKQKLAEAKTQFQLRDKSLKSAQGMEIAAAKTNQDLAIKDALAAQEVRHKEQTQNGVDSGK